MSANTEVPDGIEDEDLAAALRVLETVTRDLEAAKLAIVTAKDELAVTLFVASAPYRSGEAPLPIEWLRILYWERPEVRVRDIARAFGIRLGEIAAVVGPRMEPGTCTDCEDDTEVARRTRSHRPTARCPPCVEKLLHLDRWRREHERYEQWTWRESGRYHGDYRSDDALSWMFDDDEPPAGSWPGYLPPEGP